MKGGGRRGQWYRNEGWTMGTPESPFPPLPPIQGRPATLEEREREREKKFPEKFYFLYCSANKEVWFFPPPLLCFFLLKFEALWHIWKNIYYPWLRATCDLRVAKLKSARLLILFFLIWANSKANFSQAIFPIFIKKNSFFNLADF